MADSDVSDVSNTSTNNSSHQKRHSRRQSSIGQKRDMIKSMANHWRKGSGGSAGAGSMEFSAAFLPGMGISAEDAPSADEEISLISTMKESLDKFWSKHIDIEDNGDCDIDEWVTRLKDLNVDLTEDEMKQFFNRVDDGQATFVDRNEFIQFMNHQFQNPELIKYQQAIFDKIDGAKRAGRSSNLLQPNAANGIGNGNGGDANGDGKNDDDDGGHERSHSNLVTGDDAELDDVQLHIMKQQLTSELKRQQTGHYKKLSVTESLLDTIKNEEEEHPERFDEV